MEQTEKNSCISETRTVRLRKKFLVQNSALQILNLHGESYGEPGFPHNFAKKNDRPDLKMSCIDAS